MGALKFLRATGNPESQNDLPSDERFIAQLREVEKLKKFLFEEKVQFTSEQIDAIDLGSLNNFRVTADGRQPTEEEWKLLDRKLWTLSLILTDDLRQRIRIRELSIFFSTIPIVFLSISLASIILLFTYNSIFPDTDSLPAIIMFLLSLTAWTVSQGGLGACAFLGTRVAIKRAEGKDITGSKDESADVTNRNVLKIRIVLGCLFASLVGLPISNLAVLEISKLVFAKAADEVKWDTANFALILIPFMIGFSTNLVLAVLDRFVVSIRTLFGIGSS